MPTTTRRLRLSGAYLSGAALLKLATEMRGYYPAECRAMVVNDFKEYITELVRGV